MDVVETGRWADGAIVNWVRNGVARESTDGGKTWREYTLDTTPCAHCGNPLLKRIYKDT